MDEWKDFETIEAITEPEETSIEENESVFGIPIMKVHIQGEKPPVLHKRKEDE